MVGPFEILVPLGAGGMGEVYRARDVRLGREVALKVLPATILSDREGLRRFAQEARSASALNHPNIITIFEIGHADSAPFLAMELIEGMTLRELIEAGPLSIKKVLDLAAQIADGLAKAHQAGIIHRDLKPENLMISRDGFVKILDFGLAKLQEQSAIPGTPEGNSLTQAGFILGTPDYMSPEQAAGRALDFHSDQFSAGLIFYEMLTRRRVFHRPTAVQTLSAIIQEDPEPLEKANPKVPAPLRWAIQRCLAKDPEERYASTRDLARDLRQIRDNATELVAPSDPGTTASAPTPGAARSAAPILAEELDGSTSRTRASRAGRASPAPLPRARSRGRRLLEFVLVLFVALGLFGGGAWTGNWFRAQQIEPPPPNWKADLLLGTMTRVFTPRLSPDGQALAFATLVGGTSQIAVLKPSSGDWSVLTRQSSSGSIYKVCWSRDGNKVLFDRVSDRPHGVFSVPPLGGEERMVLEDAQGPEALADGSLLVVKRDAARNFVIHRFWPETGKVVPVGPPIVAEGANWSLRAFPDGKKAIFWGKLVGSREKARRAFLLDLATGRATPFAPQLPIAPPLSIAADGRSVLAFITAGDLQEVVSVSGDGTQAKLLFPVTGKPWNLDSSADGSLYVNTMDNPAELLRFPAVGGVPDRVAMTAGALLMSPVQLPDGGLLVPNQVLGRRRLLVASRNGELRPFLDIAEQATPPAVVVGETRLAFLSGGVGKPPRIAVASIAEGRVVKRLDASEGASPQSLAASPDGRTLYYVDGGFLYSIDIDGGAPKKLRPANGVALDPRGAPPSLVVQVNDLDGVKLYRVPISGPSYEVAIPFPFQSPLRLAPMPMSGSAVGPDGRIAVTVTSKDSWFRSVALLDPAAATLERVPVAFDGDVLCPSWGRDGSLLAMGVSIRSTLWRFQAQTAKPEN